MDAAGMVFICVMFIISIAVLSFCCLKVCSSEKKYIGNLENNSKPEILPTSIANGTVHSSKKQRYTGKLSQSGVDDIMDSDNKRWQKDLYPKTGVNFASSPKQASITDKNESIVPKPDFIVNETKNTLSKSPFAVIGSQSTARYVVDRGPNVPSKQALAGCVSPKLDCTVDGSQSSTPKAGDGTQVKDGRKSVSPKPSRVLNTESSAATKSGNILDKSPSIMDGIDCASSKQEGGNKTSPIIDRNESASVRDPGFVGLAKQATLLAPKSPNEAIKPESVVNELQSAIYTTLISPCEPKQPTIGFAPTLDGVSTNNVILRHHSIRRRTPSPNPEVYRTSYSPRTSIYFAENGGSYSEIGLSSENLRQYQKPRPPSYEEAMLEYQFPPVTNSDNEQFVEYKLNR